MKKLLLISLSLCSMTLVYTGQTYSAPEDVFEPVCIKSDARDDTSGEKATLCQDSDNQAGKNPFYGANGLLGKIINILSVIGGIAAVIMIMLSGLKFITSGDNPQEVSSAKNMIIYAVVGLIIIASAQLIVRFFLAKI